jgi:hypothetical protein
VVPPKVEVVAAAPVEGAEAAADDKKGKKKK